MSKIEASRQAIDSVGVAELAQRLSEIAGETVTEYAVAKWRQRGVPGGWVAAVCAVTGADQRKLNPRVPG